MKINRILIPDIVERNDIRPFRIDEAQIADAGGMKKLPHPLFVMQTFGFAVDRAACFFVEQRVKGASRPIGIHVLSSSSGAKSLPHLARGRLDHQPPPAMVRWLIRDCRFMCRSFPPGASKIDFNCWSASERLPVCQGCFSCPVFPHHRRKRSLAC